MYDYFCGERPEYYIGIKEDVIEHWIDKDGNDHFIINIEGHEFEFKMKTKNAKTVGTKLEEVKNKTGWKQEGFYLLKNGIRRDTLLFDDNNPECHRNEKDIIIYWLSICLKHKRHAVLHSCPQTLFSIYCPNYAIQCRVVFLENL